MFGGEPRGFIQIDFALQPSLLNQHGLAWLLGGEGIPQQGIVAPPGMVGGEIDRRGIKSGGEAIPHPAFILAHGDELLRAGSADFVAHGADPFDESFLGEDEIVIDAKRVVALIHSARAEFELTRQGNVSRDGIVRCVPGSRERGAVGIAFRKPLVPCSQFDGIAVWARLPQMLRNAGLVDQIPRQERNIVKARDYRGDEGLLLAQRLRIQIRIHAAEDLRKKGEEIELHGKAVLARGHEIGFESAECTLVGLAIFIAKFVPAGPPSRAKHVETGGLDLRHVAVPDVGVGMVEIEALDFARHVCGANDGERMAVDLKEVVIDLQMRAGAQELGFANPKAGTVGGANRISFQEIGLDDMEALFLGRRKQDGLRSRQVCGLHLALRGLSLGKFADANGQRPRRLFGGVPEDLYLHGFGREIKRKRRARGEFFGALACAFGKDSNQADGISARQKL